MLPSTLSFTRSKSARSIAICASAILGFFSVQAARLSLEKPKPEYQITPEYEATLAMVSAHSPLREPEVQDPDSLSNRKALDTMIRKAMRGKASPPPFIPPQPAFDSDIVGSFDGRFSVDNKGAGEYSVSLPVPEGRGTPSPSLSLNYSSRVGHSSAGYGFYIGDGFYNAVTRGRRFHARDGEARGTELSERDRLYLDGKILICVSGTEGRPGSTYRTEVDSFVRIEGNGTDEQIEGFTLFHKSGFKYYFGKYEAEEDALHRGRNAIAPKELSPTPSQYALKRVENPFGYYLTFHYRELAPGNWKIKYIDYTGTPELPPNYRVEYKYRSLKENTSRYTAFTSQQGDFAIDQIEIQYLPDQSITNRYDFVYEDITNDGTLRLKELRPYLASDIAEPLYSISPNTFYWSKPFDAAGDYSQQDLPKSFKANEPLSSLLWADFNGDGKDDILTINESLEVLISTKNGLANSKVQDWGKLGSLLSSDPISEYAIGEFNGDGMADLLVVQENVGASILESTGESFVLRGQLKNPANADSNLKTILGDIDGDGRDDILFHRHGNELLAHLYRGNGFTESPSVTLLAPQADPTLRDTKGILTDLNGDGLDDYLWFELHAEGSASLAIRYSLSIPSSGFSTPVTLKTWNSLELQSLDNDALEQAGIGFLLGEFNADDLPDFAFGTSDGNETKWEIVLNRDQPTNMLEPTPEQLKAMSSVASTLRLPRTEQATPLQNAYSKKDARINTRELAIHGNSLPQAIDANQDGTDDLVWLEEVSTGKKKTQATLMVSYSQGNGSFAAPTALTGTFWEESDIERIASKKSKTAPGTLVLNWNCDTNGDGLNELALLRRDSIGHSKLLSIVDGFDRENVTTPLHNMLIALVEGKGRTVCASYLASRDDRAYTPGAVVKYPIREIRNTTPIVTEIWKDDSNGNFDQYGYQFSAQRSDFSGRGGLGFAAFTTIARNTGFLSFQQVTQSFPTTGLVTREEVYRTWQEGKKIHLKLVKAQDYTCTFDAVTSPFSMQYYGTVYPFQSNHILTDWEDDLGSHYTLPASVLEDLSGSKPFIGPDRPSDSLYTSTQSFYFDAQDKSKPSTETFPDIEFPWVLDQEAKPRNTKLPGEIHYGNKTLDLLDYGYGIFKKTETSYHSPSDEHDPVTSLSKRLEKSQNLDAGSDVIEAPEEYTYVPGSNYISSTKTIHSESSGSKDQKNTLKKYPRDKYGRQTASYTYDLDEELNPIEETATLTYQASEFDPVTSLPTKITYSDGEERTLTYNPIFRESKKTYYDRGITVFTRFDELGRKVSITNPSYDYSKTTNYYWTTPEGEGWSKQQQLVPPKGIDASKNRSVYVEIVRESNEATKLTYFDQAGHIIRNVEFDENDNQTTIDTLYDNQGRVKATSAPYAPDEPITWTITSYDVYGRGAETTELIQKNKRSR